MRCKVLHAPRTHLPRTATIRWRAGQASHLVAQNATRNATTAVHTEPETITISVFVLVEVRKRRDSNPRYLSVRSLSRSSTRRSAMTTPAVSAGHLRGRGHSRALLIASECNHKCHHGGRVSQNTPRQPVRRLDCWSAGTQPVRTRPPQRPPPAETRDGGVVAGPDVCGLTSLARVSRCAGQ
jgi:hypothetical protein